MTVPEKKVNTIISTNLRGPQILTALVIALTTVFSAGGLFLTGLYRDNQWLVAQVQGEDFPYCR